MIPLDQRLTRSELDEFYQYNGLLPGQSFHLNPSIKTFNTLAIEVFDCNHRIPTISYGISESRQKLRAEYTNLSGKEIAQLRKKGTSVTEEALIPRIAYVCDTTIHVFEINAMLLRYPVIMIECTFLRNEDADADKSHIFWPELEPFVANNPGIQFMLFHFSQRYKDAEIAEFFDEIIRAKGYGNLNYWA